MSRCWICGGPVEPCARFAPEPFIECRHCGFVFRPDLDGEALKRIYVEGSYEDSHGEQYVSELAERRREARVRLRYVQPWAQRARLLDVGAASGAFVAEAVEQGFDACGIEPVASFARVAREVLGLDVRDGDIEDIETDSVKFQVITLWHVLEHVPEPVRHLRRLTDVLTPGGVLAVEVPNAGSALASHMGAAWPSLEPTVHVNQFTPPSLRSALERAGLEICDVGTTLVTPYLPLHARLDPRHLGGRARAALWLRDPRVVHPTGHELLRAVARRA
jgi:SAM-dependent methyltransferase